MQLPRRHTSSLLLLTLLLFTACATTGRAHEFEPQAEYEGASFDAVWDGVVDVFGDHNWVISNMERASGIISTDFMLFDRESYADCGDPGMGSDQDYMGRFNVVVREASNGSSLRVTSSWQVTRIDGWNGSRSSVQCYSTGVLERQIHDEVRVRLGIDTR